MTLGRCISSRAELPPPDYFEPSKFMDPTVDPVKEDEKDAETPSKADKGERARRWRLPIFREKRSRQACSVPSGE